MMTRLSWTGAIVVAALTVGTPFLYKSVMSTKYRNLRVVEPQKLYRSGQLSVTGLANTVRENGIRTVVCLRDARDDGKPAPDDDEAEWCRANNVRHVVLTPARWEARSPGVAPPIEPNLREFLTIMGDPDQLPVLVHCFAGIHRTGGYVALYRMEHNGWTADEAIREMHSMGTPRTTFDGETENYLKNYTPGGLLNPPAQ